MISRRSFVQSAALAALGVNASAAGTAGSAEPATGPYDWQSVPFGAGGFIDGFVFHPAAPGLLYARTDIGGAYRFDAAAGRWLPLMDHLGRADADLMGVLSLAVDPSDADRVYAACGLYTGDWARKAALLSSQDRGRSWTVTELGIRLGGNEGGRGTGERLQVDPDRGEILLLGTTRDGLLRSADRGRSFQATDFAPRHVSLVLFDPASADAGKGCRTVWVGSHDQPGLWLSRDGGRSFVREAATPALVPQRAAIAADGHLYVSFAGGNGPWATNPGSATAGSVWRRGPAGRWTDISPLPRGSFGYSGLDIAGRQPGRIVVSTIERWGEGDDLFISDDHGAHWTPLGAKSRHDATAWPWLQAYMAGKDRMGHWIADLKIDPADPDRMVYGTGYGLWITGNLGAARQGGRVDWAFTVAGLEETATPDLKSPSGGATLMAAMADVSGGAWDDIGRTPGAGVFTPPTETHRSVDFAQLAPAVLARTSDAAPTGGHVSLDGGVSWRAFGASARQARGADGRTLEAGHVAVSARGGAFVWAPQGQPALHSRDRGRSWQPCTGWPDAAGASLVPVADRAVEGVFYVHDRAGGRLLVSVDAGASFQSMVNGLPKVEPWQTSQLVSASTGPRDLWLALPDGLLHLAGAEARVRTIARVPEAWLVTLGQAAPGAAYPSVYLWGRVVVSGVESEGLFRSDDAGASFVRISDDRHRFGRLQAIAADPLEYGTLYVAAHGRGVLVGKPRKA